MEVCFHHIRGRRTSQACADVNPVVTAFKIRAYKYTNKIYAGIVMYPRESLPQVAKKVTAFVRENNDPKMALHFYCLNLTHGDPLQDKPVPGIAVMVYDGHGEEHGRSEVGFKWALDIEGAVDTTSAITYRQANQLAGKTISLHVRYLTSAHLRHRQPQEHQGPDKHLLRRRHDSHHRRGTDLPRLGMVRQPDRERT